MRNTKISAVAGFAAAAGLALVAIAGPGASASSAAPPCTPKTPTIKGNPAMALCGPATATLMVGGRTYSFANGFCAEQIPNSDSFQLSLGTDVPTLSGPNNNAGQPFFSMDIANGHTSASVAAAYSGGRKLLANAPMSLSSKNPMKGSFKSKGPGPSFTGAWNCHGVLSRS
jgi:hypothetical protein